MRKLSWLLAATVMVVTSVPAAASYELSLIYDVDNRQILRYDPISNRALGSFGTGLMGYYGNAVKLALDPVRAGTVATLNVSGSVRWFDYSTGEVVETTDLTPNGGFVQADSFHILRDGGMMATTSSGVRVYDRNGVPRFDFTGYVGYTTIDAIPLANGTFLSLERNVSGSGYGYSLFRRDVGGTYTDGLFGWRTSSLSTHLRRLTTDGNEIFATGTDGVYPSMAAARFSGATFVNRSYGLTMMASGMPSAVSLLHEGSGIFLARGTADSLNTRYRVDRMETSAFNDATMPYSQNLGDIVTVVAPEPGTIIAMGVGLAVLVRRRRRA